MQGVGFRWFVVEAASGLGIVGWVRNREDGNVEIWAEGPDAALGQLVDEVSRGPRHARVDSVDRLPAEATGAHGTFEVRR